MREMNAYTVTLHANGAIAYSEPVTIKWKENETHCEDCDNGTDTPCAVCLDEEAGK
jgi:hypothetical protein